tara:strand:- start:320 stop:526 length:207 start_codon:yes stop_codon:yes gene_type:complete
MREKEADREKVEVKVAPVVATAQEVADASRTARVDPFVSDQQLAHLPIGPQPNQPMLSLPYRLTPIHP